MAIAGRIGAVYILHTAPLNFDKEPDDMEQVGVLFLWEADVQQSFYHSFANNTVEKGNVVTGWYATAEGYCGDTKFFANKGKTIFVKLFIGAGTSLKCLQGYAVLPEFIEGAPNQIIKEQIYLQGIGIMRLGGVT
jgi:uncharacterized low-complexity protein